MIDALATYCLYAAAFILTLGLTGIALLLAVCVGGMIHALYKGATDPDWR